MSRSSLPGWLERAFWAIVAVEWTAVVAALVTLATPLWHGPTRRALIGMTCLDPNLTRFAPGYSEQGWATVHVGDEAVSVIQRLGEPLSRWVRPGDTWWAYSAETEASDSYRVRALRLNNAGRVLEKSTECYVD